MVHFPPMHNSEVSEAIINSSSVGITSTLTLPSSLLIRASCALVWLRSGSISIHKNSSSSHTLALIEP